MPTSKTEIISTLEGLEKCRPGWNDAVESSVFSSVFLTYEWFFSWIRHFAGNHPLCIVVAENDRKLLGVMPFLEERRRILGSDYLVLRSPSNYHSNKYGFIIDSSSCESILEQMIDFVSGQTDWDLMELDFIPDSARTISLLRRLEGKSFYRLHIEPLMESPYVAVSGSWEDYLGSRDKKVRRNLDYFEKKLHREGNVELLGIEGGNDLETCLTEAFEIERKSWKGEAGTAIADSEDEREFYLELASAMSRQGRFALYFLLLNGKKIAFDYCLKYRDHFLVLKTGYDPAYAKSSPGRVLRLKVLRNLYREGRYSHYDLLGSLEKWKTEWTDSAQRMCRVSVFNKKPGSILLYNAMNARESIKRSIRNFPVAYQSLKQIRDGILQMRTR